MTVEELRKLLKEVPGDMTIAFDNCFGGLITKGIKIKVTPCASIPNHPDPRPFPILERDGMRSHPRDSVGQFYLVIKPS